MLSIHVFENVTRMSTFITSIAHNIKIKYFQNINSVALEKNVLFYY